MIEALLIPAAVALALLLAVYGLSLRARGTREQRARVTELLARAVGKELPLPRLVERCAREQRGRRGERLRDLARRLDRGEALADALAATKLATPEGAAAVRAVEGTTGLPAVLSLLADEYGRSSALRHRLVVTLLYPATAAAAYFGFGALRSVVKREVLPLLETAFPGQSGLVALTLLVGLFFLGRSAPWLWSRRIGSFRLLPRFHSGLAASVRLLRVVAVHLELGSTLPAALDAAAPTVGSARRTSRIRCAARELRRGGAPSHAWSRCGLPDSLARRLASTPAVGLPAAARALADDCVRRREERDRRIVAIAGPAAIALLALVLFLDFRELMARVTTARADAMTRVPPW